MKRDAGKEKFWREVVGEACGSGQTVREFCRQRGLKENQFYMWRRELKRRDAEAAETGGFVELVGALDRTGAPAGVSIRVDDRVRIVLDRGFDREALKAALGCLCPPGGAQRAMGEARAR